MDRQLASAGMVWFRKLRLKMHGPGKRMNTGLTWTHPNVPMMRVETCVFVSLVSLARPKSATCAPHLNTYGRDRRGETVRRQQQLASILLLYLMNNNSPRQPCLCLERIVEQDVGGLYIPVDDPRVTCK